MAVLPKINKDTDVAIEITIKDENGVAIDISGLAGLVIRVFQDRYDIDIFSLNTQVGFEDIEVVDAVNGIVKIRINNDKTDCALVGKQIFYEAKTTAVDVSYSGGTVEKSTGKILLAMFDDTTLSGTTFS